MTSRREPFGVSSVSKKTNLWEKDSFSGTNCSFHCEEMFYLFFLLFCVGKKSFLVWTFEAFVGWEKWRTAGPTMKKVISAHKRQTARESDCLVKYTFCFCFLLPFLISRWLIHFYFILACLNAFQGAEETFHTSQSAAAGTPATSETCWWKLFKSSACFPPD